MCSGDDHNCPEFELHRQKLLDDLDCERRSFLKSAFVAGGGARGVGRERHAGLSGVGANEPSGPADLPLPAGHRRDRALGLFQQEPQAAGRGRVRRLRHHRDADPPRQRRRRAHGQGRSGRRERLLWDKDKKGVNRRGAGPMDGTLFGPRRRRGPRRAHLHRPGRCPRRRAGRHPRGAHPGREAAAVRQPGVCRQERSAATPPPGGASTTTT